MLDKDVNDFKSNDSEPPGDSASINDLLPKLHVAILYSDVKREYFETEQLYLAEVGAEQYAQNIGDVLVSMGVTVDLILGNDRMPATLRENKYDMAINLVDTVRGEDSMAAIIPGVLELLGIPYTGTGMLGISLAANKFLIGSMYESVGIPVPRQHLFSSSNDYIPNDLRYPLISKLNETHGSIELSSLAISENEDQLKERLRYLFSTYKQSVIVEEFIAGRELSAVYFEGKNRKVYIAEKRFYSEDPYAFITFDIKQKEDTHSIYTTDKYSDENLKELIKKAATVAHISDYCRFDIRLDISGRYYFIDTNPNPFFSLPETGSTMTQIMQLYGVEIDEVLRRMIANTLL